MNCSRSSDVKGASLTSVIKIPFSLINLDIVFRITRLVLTAFFTILMAHELGPSTSSSILTDLSIIKPSIQISAVENKSSPITKSQLIPHIGTVQFLKYAQNKLLNDVTHRSYYGQKLSNTCISTRCRKLALDRIDRTYESRLISSCKHDKNLPA